MSARNDARKEFAKEKELEKLRAKKAAEETKLAGMSEDERAAYLKKSKRVKTISVLVVIAFFVMIFVFANNSDNARNAKAATFTGKVDSISVVNPATVNVVLDITNTSQNAGIPNCNVNVADPGNSYTGFDSPIFDTPFDAGQVKTINMNLTVTGQGAQYVTGGTVTCS